MRSDASSLLKRLSKPGFAYREFPDPIADLELWPIFEALLTDLRVVEDPISRVEEREAEFREARERHQVSHNAPPSAPEAPQSELSSLFSAYGSADKPLPKPDGKTEARGDLRSFLKRLEGGE